jgi:MoaD family protein
MRVTIRSFAMIREILGNKAIVLDLPQGSTISSLIDDLVKEYHDLKSILHDDEGNINRSYLIALNDEKIEQDNFSNANLKNNDTIHIIPPAGGG